MATIVKVIFRRRKSLVSNEDEAAEKIASLIRSRKVIVDAYEIERRRIERDLHDGTQQFLVLAAMKIGEAQLSLPPDSQASTLLADAKDALQTGLDSLRKTVRGIHPQVLSELGLEAAISDIVSRSGGKVRLVCPNPLPEMPEGVLATAYFFTSEAITNASKYAPEANVTVLMAADDNLRISVVDNGLGGATLIPGHGLAGMHERLAAFGGQMEISSPSGGPTNVSAKIPLLIERGKSIIKLNGDENG